jgi:hypothetical protein
MPPVLDSAAFQALLNALAPQPEQAGQAYESLRIRLIRFFNWNNCPTPEDLADSALDRLAEKLARGSDAIADPAGFVFGIAKMMLNEQAARQTRENRVLALFSWFVRQPSGDDDDFISAAEALSHCLGVLSTASRTLLDRYYTGDAGDRIRNRQSLANELGLGLNALRNRALRLRRQLEDCATNRLARGQHGDRTRSKLTPNKRTVA